MGTGLNGCCAWFCWQGPLAHLFPVENRLIGQTTNDLRYHLQATASKAYCERLADFHLLLFLSKSLDLGTDMALLVNAVKTKGTVAEGYRLIIDSIAGRSYVVCYCSHKLRFLIGLLARSTKC